MKDKVVNSFVSLIGLVLLGVALVGLVAAVGAVVGGAALSTLVAWKVFWFVVAGVVGGVFCRLS